MKYDYSKLRGLIREHVGTLKNFSEALGISATSLNERLNNNVAFKQDEMDKALEILNQDPESIREIFYSRSTENRKTVKTH